MSSHMVARRRGRRSSYVDHEGSLFLLLSPEHYETFLRTWHYERF